jgi:hypothetical protein
MVCKTGRGAGSFGGASESRPRLRTFTTVFFWHEARSSDAHDVRPLRRFGHNRFDPLAEHRQRLPLLGIVRSPVVDGGDALELVVEYAVDVVWPDAAVAHHSGGGPAQIVGSESRQSRELQEPCVRMRQPAEVPALLPRLQHPLGGAG